MVGPKLRIGPTHALRLTLERGAMQHGALLLHLEKYHNVSPARSDRAIRRAQRQGQIATDDKGQIYIASAKGEWW